METNYPCIVCGNPVVGVKPSRLERTKTGLSCSRECRAEFMKTHYAGDRIAQLIPKQYSMVEIEVVEELSSTDRGSGGFGSTGK